MGDGFLFIRAMKKSTSFRKEIMDFRAVKLYSVSNMLPAMFPTMGWIWLFSRFDQVVRRFPKQDLKQKGGEAIENCKFMKEAHTARLASEVYAP